MAKESTSVQFTADLKHYNYHQVYQAIYHENGTATRQSLASQLHLSLPTVSQNIQKLMDKGLVRRAGCLPSAGGRKPYAYQATATARVAVGLEIIKEMAHIVVTDLYGNFLLDDSFFLPFNNSQIYFNTVCNWVNEKIHQLKIPKNHILGIGIAAQGLLSKDQTEIDFGPFSGVKISEFSDRLELPCLMFHDAELAARAEIWAHKELPNFTYLSLNRNFGSALILNGTVYTGNSSFSSVIEHMQLIPDGKLCYCGKHGCVEAYCSANALQELAKESLDLFFVNLRKGSIREEKIWDSYLHSLSSVIDNIRMVLRNDIIIGGLLQSYMIQEDFERLAQYVNKTTFYKVDNLKICSGSFANRAASIGGGLYYINHFLETL